jgi:hypothetical protein
MAIATVLCVMKQSEFEPYQMGVIEWNEAFASRSLALIRTWNSICMWSISMLMPMGWGIPSSLTGQSLSSRP